jgi:methyl-accepting chemotaxis protein
MMKNWSIGRRVSITCGVLLGLMLVAGVAGTLGIRKGASSIELMMSDSAMGLEALANIRGAVGELRGDAMASPVPGLEMIRAKNLEGVAKLRKTIPEALDAYEKTITADEDRILFNKIKAAAGPYLDTCARFATLVQEGKLSDAAAMYGAEGRAQYVALDEAIGAEVDYNTKHAEAVYHDALSQSRWSMTLTWIVIGLAGLMGGGLAFTVIRGISSALNQCADEINTSAQQVVSASTQLTATSESLAQGSSEQAASLEETSSSSQEIGAMTVRNAENTNRAAVLMQEVDGRVVEANQALGEMTTSMDRIASSSNEIAKIIKVIDDIAFQTNILALNAAVEAARAGEAGMSFAVVADEVRNLAQRCAQAAKDTTLLIESSVTNARSGTEKVVRVSTVIDSVTQSASQIKTLINELNGAANQQSRGVEQISSALNQMEQVTQKTAANAEESASASQQLKAQAESMSAIINSLRLLATGTAG